MHACVKRYKDRILDTMKVKIVEFEYFALLLFLPETKGKSQKRQKILDAVKTFISSIDAVRDMNVNISKRHVTVESKDLAVKIESTKQFSISFIITTKKPLESINMIMNQVLEKLNKIVGKEMKSEIRVGTLGRHKLSRKYKPFSRLIGEDVMKDFSKLGVKFKPKMVEIGTEKTKKGKWSRFGVNAKIRRNILDIYLIFVYKDLFPNDIVKKAIRDTSEYLDKVLTTLVKDGQ